MYHRPYAGERKRRRLFFFFSSHPMTIWVYQQIRIIFTHTEIHAHRNKQIQIPERNGMRSYDTGLLRWEKRFSGVKSACRDTYTERGKQRSLFVP